VQKNCFLSLKLKNFELIKLRAEGSACIRFPRKPKSRCADDVNPLQLSIGSSNVKVYPVPFRNTFTIDLLAGTVGPLVIRLTDIQGRTVKKYTVTPTSNQTRIILDDLSGRAGGPYILTFGNAKQVGSIKLVKN
jgi:hypothetical protein